MSATVVVSRWARATETRLRDVLRAAAQDVAENVSVGGVYSPGTPVDTGFARAMWQADLNDGSIVAQDRPSGLDKDAYIAEAGDAASGMNLVIASADLGDTIVLSNRASYLPYLEDGSTTPKAPFVSGWIAQTVTAWPLIVSRSVARVRGRR